MATYLQWARHRKISRVAWVCGNEWALMRDVRNTHVSELQDADPLVMWAGRSGGVWDELLTVPAGPRLALVSEAERLDPLSLLPHLLGEEFDGSFTVFFSSEDDFRRRDKKLIAPLAALRDSRHGQLVRCCAPAGEEDRADIVASWWPGAGRNVGNVLLAMCGGDLNAAWHAANKAVRAGLAPGDKALPLVCLRGSSEDFADLMLAGKRREAMAASREIPAESAGAALGLMAVRLDIIPLVREAVQRREQPSDTVRRLRLDPWVLRKMRPYAAGYDPQRVTRCRELLAIAETAWRSGVRDGILEAVAALW